jgi:SSS family solute:Na+ symporter
MVVSFVVAVCMQFAPPESLADWQKLTIGVGITTLAWVLVTLVTPADDAGRLRSFYRLIRPGGPGWRKVIADAARDGEHIAAAGRGHWNVPQGVLCMVLGCFAVYSALFGTGYWIYGQTGPALGYTLLFAVSSTVLAVVFGRMWSAEHA